MGKEGNTTDLSKAHLAGANLSKAVLTKANLSNAFLRDANLSNAFLAEVNLSSANLVRTNLSNANLGRANLENANLINANLNEARLISTNLSNAQLWDANLSKAIFEIEPGSLPNLPSIARAKNLSTLTYQNSRHALIELRNAFKEAGLRDQEREITYAVNYTDRLKWDKTIYKLTEQSFKYLELKEIPNEIRNSLLNIKDQEFKRTIYFINIIQNIIGDKLTVKYKSLILKSANKKGNWWAWKIESIFNLIMFELTCKYGMSPGRPLLVLVFLIPIFSIPYIVSLIIQRDHEGGRSGIWIVWASDRMRKDIGTNKPSLLNINGFSKALLWGFYFSILSAFHIGWRELNVGNWLARIQPREFSLRASGWIRTISTIQSLISVYLLALCVLTYFGRLF